MSWTVRPGTISGELRVPGDKSIAHRALMLAALAGGRSTLRNVSSGGDVRATASSLGQLGARLYGPSPEVVVVEGKALAASKQPVDCANSGTTMRLMAGVLAAHPFSTTLVGDASLSRRPMNRVIEPLQKMGGDLHADGGHAPIQINGGQLHGVDYTPPIASAQVKSAVMFAGMLAEGTTRIYEPLATRDHTERLMAAVGVDVKKENGTIELSGPQRPFPLSIDIPGDLSSAAFLFAAAAVTGGCVRVCEVGINPSRTRFLDVLKAMGAIVIVENAGDSCNEPYADVTVTGSLRSAVSVDEADVPLLIDELPLVALLATQCTGTTVIRGAGELRVKESDRIRVVASMLRRLAAEVEETPDGLIITGPTELAGGATLHSVGDHRIGMLAVVAALASQGKTVIDDTESIAVSFPSFAETLRHLGARIDEI